MRERNQYLVFIDNRDEEFSMVMDAYDIFHRMDMSDCTDERITAIYRLRPNMKRKLQRVEFYGVWHDFKDPLLMEIKDGKGRTLDYDLGTDH